MKNIKKKYMHEEFALEIDLMIIFSAKCEVHANTEARVIRVLTNIDEALKATSVGTRDTVARVVRATLTVLEKQLTLGPLLAQLPDPGSGFQTFLTILGQNVVHLAVALVLYALGILYDALIVVITTPAQR